MSGKPRKAFTLIELLIVIAIIALLISIGVPNLRKARKQGKAVVCGNRLHQQGLALTIFTSENDGLIPRERNIAFPGGTAYMTYAAFIAPAMGYTFIADQFPHEKQYAEMEEFQCPDFPRGLPTIRLSSSFPQEYSEDQALDYVYSNFPMSYVGEGDKDALKTVIDRSALPSSGSMANPDPLVRMSWVRKPARLIYVSEAHQNLPTHPGVHDVHRGAHLPRGKTPRVAVHNRHPGGIHSLYLDYHIERAAPEKQTLKDWHDPQAHASGAR